MVKVQEISQPKSLMIWLRDSPTLGGNPSCKIKSLHSEDKKWVVANGLIYDMFKSRHEIEPEDIPYEDIVKWCVGVDYGTANATAFLLCGKTADGTIYVCKEYYFAGRLEAQAQNDFEAQKTDLEYAEDMKKFISDNYQICA